MKRIKIVISGVIVLTIMIPSLSFVVADDSVEVNTKNKRLEKEVRLENREKRIEWIKKELASTTASTSEKKIEKLNNKLEKQREKMGEARERLLDKELQVTDVLGKIADKIGDRIIISENRGLDMTAAKTKLAEASVKIEEITIEGQTLADLIKTEITETNKDTLFASVKTSQNKIRTLAKATHALLVDTVKEITKVLPKKNSATSTPNI